MIVPLPAQDRIKLIISLVTQFGEELNSSMYVKTIFGITHYNVDSYYAYLQYIHVCTCTCTCTVCIYMYTMMCASGPHFECGEGG